jgi:hypothetical protein
MDPLVGTAVEYETLPWDTSPAASYVRAAQQQQGSYRAAISANIADLTVNLPSDVLADAEDASREVTRFDAELGGEIAPFSSVLLRTESAATSNIENLTASVRAIAEAELPGAKTTANAKVIVANTAAMVAAIKLADNQQCARGGDGNGVSRCQHWLSAPGADRPDALNCQWVLA